LIAALVTALTSAAVVATLWALRSGSRLHRTFKMTAATGFVAMALTAGAADTGYGRVVLVALALSWIGDLSLTYPGKKAFLAGLAAFLLAHMAYVAAFVVRGTASPHPLEVAAIGIVSLAAVGWMFPHVGRSMRGPVLAYVVAITAMVILAGSTAEFEADARLRLGAVLFYLSDIMVARDRFVAPGFANRLVGLPLYFGGQLLLAWSAGG
jgi:uncharacterized membrane protein YhhN